jgi:hypothetical protein
MNRYINIWKNLRITTFFAMLAVLTFGYVKGYAVGPFEVALPGEVAYPQIVKQFPEKYNDMQQHDKDMEKQRRDVNRENANHKKEERQQKSEDKKKK